MFHKCFNLKGICGITFSRKSFLQKSHLQSQKCRFQSSFITSPEEILSDSNREKCIASLNSLKPPRISTKQKLKKAAVLVPLCKVDNQVSILYTVRAIHLKVNGGEVAFPGGMLETSDESLQAAALRETYEETGIVPSEVDIWGKGPEINRRDVSVTPYLGYIEHLDFHKLSLNPSEVSNAFAVPLDHLSSPEHFRITRFRLGKGYIYKTPVYLKPEKRIWGLTAYITHIVLSSLIPEYYNNRINFNPSNQKVIYTK